MMPGATSSVGRQLEAIFEGGSVLGLSDRQLVERYTTGGGDATGEAAFAALVCRHGPMVLRVCREVLGDYQHAEDTFQAVFLVLARKARAIREPDQLGNWLYGVAIRTARCARQRIARHQRKEDDAMRWLGDDRRASVSVAGPRADGPAVASEQAEALHAEIARLPRAFRLPVVLCYFEGVTLDEAARRLRCPAGTVHSRLARARERLRVGLSRRGIALPAAALSAALVPRQASASIPPLLCESTTRAAIAFAARRAAGAALSAHAAGLAQEVLRTMLIHKLNVMVFCFLSLATVAAGARYTIRTPVTARDEPRRATAAASASATTKPDDSARYFQFDGAISRQVLENYLDRSISFAELLHDDLAQPRNNRGVDPRDNMRLILSSKAKFVGRAIMLWGQDQNLPGLLRTAKPYAAALHKADPEIVLQATTFEIVSPGVESILVPEKVFAEFSLPYQKRNFHYHDMLYADGRFVNYWEGRGSVPDMSRRETRMWFYFLAQSYIDVGIEAIHFGRVDLMDKEDPHHAHWIDMLDRVRAYARKYARRHYVLCDAPVPTVEGGKLLFDFQSSSLRIAEVPDRPYQGVLDAGHPTAGLSNGGGGITPSGWSCAQSPRLLEFDNVGLGSPGEPSKPPFVWGWDEITWFALLPEAERNQWLRYAWNSVKERDPNCHLQMPGSRILTPGKPNAPHRYWANTRSDASPQGFNTESTIKELWQTN
jgi:RNA polymerase sigma factor (sigma-70 family)